MQMHLNLETKPTRQSWAFAVDLGRKVSRSRGKRLARASRSGLSHLSRVSVRRRETQRSRTGEYGDSVSETASRKSAKPAASLALPESRLAGEEVRRCVITACSLEAKTFGVRAGMRYDEAKALIPDMRILIYNR